QADDGANDVDRAAAAQARRRHAVRRLQLLRFSRAGHGATAAHGERPHERSARPGAAARRVTAAGLRARRRDTDPVGATGNRASAISFLGRSGLTFTDSIASDSAPRTAP